MKRIVSFCLFLCLASPLFAAGNKKTDIIKAKNKIPNSYIVVLESRVDDVDGTADELTKQHFGKLKHLYKAALKGSPPRCPTKKRRSLPPIRACSTSKKTRS